MNRRAEVKTVQSRDEASVSTGRRKAMPRFSIIVAVYNAEQYLDECLDSICGQTCGDFDIIIGIVP